MKKAIIAMSGGVDSTISALLLKQQGYHLQAIYMNNWSETCQDKNYDQVQKASKILDIPCRRLDLSKEYWTYVFDPFLSGLMDGQTPNPDITCNKYIKFGLFYQKCRELYPDYESLAFGHYANQRFVNNRLRLVTPRDVRKDQTFYLSNVEESVLRNVLFPLSGLLKSQVYQLAHENGLSEIAREKESMGICFIGKRNFGSFVSEYIPQERGKFVTLEGKVVGEFEGMAYYTIGQSARIKGLPKNFKYYVSKKDFVNNVMVVVPANHDDLYTTVLKVKDVHWIAGIDEGITDCMIKYRYGSAPVAGIIRRNSDSTITIDLANRVSKAAPGQSIAIYDSNLDVCYGGGIILE